MPSSSSPATSEDTGPKLLLDWREPEESSRHWQAAIGTLLFHALLVPTLVTILRLEPARTFEEREIALVRHATPLIAPRLTQKEPNKQKPAKEVKLENLLPKPEVTPRTPTPPAPAKTFHPPVNPLPPAPKPAALPPPPEPPQYMASAKPSGQLPQSIINVPPPQIQPEEKPKLTFERPGQGGLSSVAGGAPMKIPIPKPTIDEAIRSVARGGGGQGGIVVGDLDQLPSAPDPLHRAPSPARTQSQLELLSDPMGVDFKPYLIRILATVRRNWFAVIPESARLGRRGRVSLQFSIDRSGKVPKLVISMPSGAEALDRAAVAGISASVPFPPLPAEFKGTQIVLQFSFQYNMN